MGFAKPPVAVLKEELVKSRLIPASTRSDIAENKGKAMSLSVNDLSFTYNSGLPTEAKALQNISFSAEKGEILSIVGHTGSGKSTLAMHLCTFDPSIG